MRTSGGSTATTLSSTISAVELNLRDTESRAQRAADQLTVLTLAMLRRRHAPAH